MSIFTVFKPYGQTPKEIVDEVIACMGAKKGTFSGRLDPMACGVLKIFLDEKCKLAHHFDKEDKEYRVKFAFDISTTSGDMLGYPTYHKQSNFVTLQDIICALEKMKTQPYFQTVPKHSSYQVKNECGEKHPLWWWAMHHRLHEVCLPVFEKKLYDYTIYGFKEVLLSEIATLAIERISKIDKKHNFSQQHIVEHWASLQTRSDPILIFEMKMVVSSGFYVRQCIQDLFPNRPVMVIEIERMRYLKCDI